MIRRITTRFTIEYGVDIPIAQAPMAFVGTATDLAIATCLAGGVGALAAGPLPADAVRDLIRAVRTRTDRPLNVNFITFLARADQIEVCIEQRVPIVSFHWGPPSPAWIEQLHDAGVKVWEQVGSAETAAAAVESGIDAIVAQSSEAGGHNYGGLPMFVLLPEIRQSIGPQPILLAAGGVATGPQLAAALALGADAVAMGTRLIASREAFAHDEYKARLVRARGTETRLTAVYGRDRPEFNPMRVLDVGLAREFAGREREAPADLECQPVIASMRLAGDDLPLRRFSSFPPTPQTTGRIDELPFLAGQGVGLVNGIEPVQAIIDRIVDDAAACMAGLPSRPGHATA